MATAPVLNMTLTQRLNLLNDDDRKQMESAYNFWDSKDHVEMSFPLSVLAEALGLTRSTDGVDKIQRDYGDMKAEFVIVSPEELSKIDPDEKYGSYVGGCIFVSSQVPEEYLPMVVANLAFLKHIGSDNPIKKLIEDTSLTVDESQHWSANVLDILLAQKYLAGTEGGMKQYLEWRKRIERTDFFRNRQIDDFLHQRLEHLQYKRTTHPLERSVRTRLSWSIAGALYQFGQNFVERNAAMMGVTKADVILRILADKYDYEFDPEMMLRLIDHVKSACVPSSRRPSSKNYVDLREERDSDEIATQAGLLTESIMGPDHAIFTETKDRKVFLLRPHRGRSLEPLKDRIVYFLNQGVLNRGLTKKMFLLLQRSNNLVAEVHGKKLEIKLGIGEEEQKKTIEDLNEQERLVLAQLKKVGELLEKCARLRERFEEFGSINVVPARIDAEGKQLCGLRDQLGRNLEEIRSAMTLFDDVISVTREKEALLNALATTGPEDSTPETSLDTPPDKDKN